MALRQGVSMIVNRLLKPFDVEIRRRFSGGPRRTTMLAAFERLKSLGFAPASVIDVGVATGTPPLYAVFPNARYVLIEPLREFASDLERIVTQLGNAEYVLAAAGDTTGQAVLNIGTVLEIASHGRMRDGSFPPHEERIVPTVTLNDIWRERNLKGPALLKVDVEGSEISVLRGGEEILRETDCAVIECAFRPLYSHAMLADSTIRYMADRGFHVDDIVEVAYGPGGHLTTADCLFIRDDSDLARKAQR